MPRMTLLLLLAALLQVWAAQAIHHDILIVVDGARPSHRQQEQALRLELEKLRAAANITSRQLPIDTYDISRPSHRTAVQRMGIGSATLPYVGVYVWNSKTRLPQTVLWGLGPVRDARDAAQKAWEFVPKQTATLTFDASGIFISSAGADTIFALPPGFKPYREGKNAGVLSIFTGADGALLTSARRGTTDGVFDAQIRVYQAVRKTLAGSETPGSTFEVRLRPGGSAHHFKAWNYAQDFGSFRGAWRHDLWVDRAFLDNGMTVIVEGLFWDPQSRQWSVQSNPKVVCSTVVGGPVLAPEEADRQARAEGTTLQAMVKDILMVQQTAAGTARVTR